MSMKTGAEIPNRAEDITPDWLSRALSGAFPGIVVTSVRPEPLHEGTASTWRLHLDVAGDQGPSTLCIKSSVGLPHGEQLAKAGLYRKEALVYLEVLPTTGPRVAACLAAGFDEAGHGFMLLEDVDASGGRFCMPVEPLSVEQVATGLEQLAVLHAAQWRAPSLIESRWQHHGLPLSKPDPFWVTLFDQYREFLDTPHGGAVASVYRDAGAVLKAISRLRLLDDTTANCLIHGDAHVGNFFVDADRQPGMADFQCVQRGNQRHDLAMFIASALDVVDRRAHEVELLHHLSRPPRTARNFSAGIRRDMARLPTPPPVRARRLDLHDRPVPTRAAPRHQRLPLRHRGTRPRRHRCHRRRDNTMTAPVLDFPEGWFQVAYSDDLAPGDVIAKRYFDRELVLFRTEDGAAQVFDAHCAHFGANLAVGGRVEGECIRCPFHAWAYGPDGRCVDIPYAQRIPKGAAVKAWETRERSGIIYLWFSPANDQPTWEPPELPEHDDPEWRGYQRHHFVLPTTAQEVVENIFDVPHGQFVHDNAQGTAAADVDFSFADHRATVEFRLELPLVGGKTTHITEVYGLGVVTNHSTGHGTKAFLSTYTPIDANTLDVNFSFMTPKSTPDDPTGERSLASAQATVTLFAQDIPIWENKVYCPTPLFCDGDKVASQYRRWVRQFYAETPEIGRAARR